MRRTWFRITRAWVKRREAILIAEEDAAIRAAREDARTDEERAFMDALITQRERSNRPARAVLTAH